MPSTSWRMERWRFWQMVNRAPTLSETLSPCSARDTPLEKCPCSAEAGTATIRAVEDTDLLNIGKDDFERLVATDRQLADAVKRISHQRAISNLSAGGTDAALWAKVASGSLDHLSRHQTGKMLTEAAKGAGMAIVF